MFEDTYDLASGRLIDSISDRPNQSESQGDTSRDDRRAVAGEGSPEATRNHARRSTHSASRSTAETALVSLRTRIPTGMIYVGWCRRLDLAAADLLASSASETQPMK